VGPIEHIFTQNLCRRTVQNKGWRTYGSLIDS
jgi:hypothetical protein